MKVLHIVSELTPEAGGPSVTVTHLTDALSHQDSVKVTLLSQCPVNRLVVAPASNSEVCRIIAQSSNKIALSLGLPLNRQLQSCLNLHKPDIIHGHGLWHPVSYWCSQIANKYKVPLAIHSHGMLEPWALNHRKSKKRIALWLYQHRDLQRAKVLFATAEQEAQNFRHFGLRQPIAIIPNGIPFPALESQVSPPQSSRYRTALFLSRIHPKKGLINLIQAWHQISPPGWQLIIAGPNENNHLAQVKAQIKQHQLEPVIKILDSVEGEAKANLYRQADLFILPTFSENFGVVVAEALSYGVPVITTTGTPWQDLQTYRCGWWVEPTVATIADALQEATILHLQELRTMGERGRAYVKRYDWDSIAQDTIAVYQWILGQGPKPYYVTID